MNAQLEKPVDALADGAPFASIKGRMEAVEARREVLERELPDYPVAEPPRLHGNLAGMYLAKVARLRDALAWEGGTEAREAVRALLARVEVHPPGEVSPEPRVELVGEIPGLVQASGVEPSRVLGARNAKSPPAGTGGLALFFCSLKSDAGTGFGVWRTPVAVR